MDTPLKNTRHERFAQLIIEGRSQADAYREVYPQSARWKDKTVHEQASRLAHDGKVSARIQALQEAAASRAVVTKRELQERLSRQLRELDEADRAFADRLESLLLAYADQSVKGADQSAFHAPYGDEERDFFWGCLSEQGANQATSLVYAYLLSGNKDYLANAYRNMDYILGRNATGYCYVTGFGSKSPMHPHHRLSAADDVAEPLPGFLVGGPNAGQQDGAAYPSSLPDESYADEVNSYASNEIAINWSAGLVALSSALDALSGQL